MQGRPVPRITWFRDGVEIEKKMNMEITDVLGSTSLFVRDATREHRGVYRVEAKNASGSSKAEITVKVQGTSNSFFILPFTGLGLETCLIAPQRTRKNKLTLEPFSYRYTRKSSWANKIHQYYWREDDPVVGRSTQ